MDFPKLGYCKRTRRLIVAAEVEIFLGTKNVSNARELLMGWTAFWKWNQSTKS